MALILHLLAASDAAHARAAGTPYVPDSYAADGFIHCTAGDEALLAVANAFYRGRSEPMVAWTIETDRLSSEVRWEAPITPDGSEPNDTSMRFPHVYGPLLMEAVIATRALRRAAGGSFVGYDDAT